MIDRSHSKLSLSAQCRELNLNRSSLYDRPKGESAENLALMRRIDELFMDYPFYGSRQMARHLSRQGMRVGRHRTRRLMRKMGLQAIYQAPRTTRPRPEYKIYPYLLKDLAITRANHAWCSDITYVPMARGFLYLVAIPPSSADGVHFMDRINDLLTIDGLGDAQDLELPAFQYHGRLVLHGGAPRGA